MSHLIRGLISYHFHLKCNNEVAIFYSISMLLQLKNVKISSAVTMLTRVLMQRYYNLQLMFGITLKLLPLDCEKKYRVLTKTFKASSKTNFLLTSSLP